MFECFIIRRFLIFVYLQHNTKYVIAKTTNQASGSFQISFESAVTNYNGGYVVTTEMELFSLFQAFRDLWPLTLFWCSPLQVRNGIRTLLMSFKDCSPSDILTSLSSGSFSPSIKVPCTCNKLRAVRCEPFHVTRLSLKLNGKCMSSIDDQMTQRNV